MEANGFKCREMVKVVVQAGVEGVEGWSWRDGWRGVWPVLALRQSNRKGDEATSNFLAPHRLSSLGSQSTERGEWGCNSSERNELTPGLGAGEGRKH